MNKLIPLITLLVLGLLAGCAPDKPKSEGDTQEPASKAIVENADPTKGLGQVKTVTLNTPLETEVLCLSQAY
jgi:hypothetical protein